MPKSSQPKSLPILFKPEMVKAILDGRKTATRRLLAVQPPSPNYRMLTLSSSTAREDRKRIGMQHWAVLNEHMEIVADQGIYFRCPYAVNQTRWVRESGWEPREPSPRDLREGADTWPRYAYDADGIGQCEAEQYAGWGWKRRPSIFMPRWASRITLRITFVRWERLQDITDADAIAEGVREFTKDGTVSKYWICDPVEGQYKNRWEFLPITARDGFAAAWDIINPDVPWRSNPVLWVVGFERVEEKDLAEAA